MRVLVIEDHPLDMKLLCVLVSSGGHEVLQASCATEALEVIERCAPDVILADLHLPDLDGLELVRRLRDLPHAQHTPVVAVTAYDSRYATHSVLAAGCALYLSKPIDTRRLEPQLRLVAAQVSQ